jgi:hypothetical protein
LKERQGEVAPTPAGFAAPGGTKNLDALGGVTDGENVARVGAEVAKGSFQIERRPNFLRYVRTALEQ